MKTGRWKKNATGEDEQSGFCFLMLTPDANLLIFRSTFRKGSVQQVGCDWMVAWREQRVTVINKYSV